MLHIISLYFTRLSRSAALYGRICIPNLRGVYKILYELVRVREVKTNCQKELL